MGVVVTYYNTHTVTRPIRHMAQPSRQDRARRHGGQVTTERTRLTLFSHFRVAGLGQAHGRNRISAAYLEPQVEHAVARDDHVGILQ